MELWFNDSVSLPPSTAAHTDQTKFPALSFNCRVSSIVQSTMISVSLFERSLTSYKAFIGRCCCPPNGAGLRGHGWRGTPEAGCSRQGDTPGADLWLRHNSTSLSPTVTRDFSMWRTSYGEAFKIWALRTLSSCSNPGSVTYLLHDFKQVM